MCNMMWTKHGQQIQKVVMGLNSELETRHFRLCAYSIINNFESIAKTIRLSIILEKL